MTYFLILIPIYKLPSQNIVQTYTKLHSNQQYLRIISSDIHQY